MSTPNELPSSASGDEALSHLAHQVDEAIEPLVLGLGDLVVADATAWTRLAGDVSNLGTVSDFQEYLGAQDPVAEVLGVADQVTAVGYFTETSDPIDPALFEDWMRQEVDGQEDTEQDIHNQIAAGREEAVRGLTVNKAWALQQPPSVRSENGAWSDGQWRVNPENGQLQFRSLGGAWISELDVDLGHARWANDIVAKQAALAYEVRKTVPSSDIDSLSANFAHVATGPGGWGLNEQQAREVWAGVAYATSHQAIGGVREQSVPAELSAAVAGEAITVEDPFLDVHAKAARHGLVIRSDLLPARPEPPHDFDSHDFPFGGEWWQ